MEVEMKKIRGSKNLMLGVFVSFMFLIFVVNAAMFVDNTEGDFDNGIFYQTFFNTTVSPGFVQLNISEGFLSGNFSSQIFDGGNNASWDNISWTQGGKYQQELPNNQGSETGLGGVEMTGNVLLMHVNEAFGTIVDSSGNGNDGTQTGGVTYGVNGKFGTALDFDGVDDYIVISSDPSLSFQDEITIEAWIYWHGEVGAQDNLQNIVTNGDWRRALRITEPDHFQPSKILATFRIGGGPVNNLYSNTQIETDTWYHVAIAYNSTDLSIYINGRFDSSVSDSGLIQGTSSDTYIGVEETTYFFYGIIDEPAIYNRSLSQKELLEHYKRGALKLNLSVRSCDDASCVGESFSDINNSSPQDLNVTDNHYFQYRVEFESLNESYTPELYNVSISYIA